MPRPETDLAFRGGRCRYSASEGGAGRVTMIRSKVDRASVMSCQWAPAIILLKGRTRAAGQRPALRFSFASVFRMRIRFFEPATGAFVIAPPSTNHD